MPFELGRPLGSPADVDGQRKVLRETLRLLERSDVPVLEEYTGPFPPDSEADLYGIACPLPSRAVPDLRSAALTEVDGLDTETGVLGLLPRDMAKFVLAFLDGTPENIAPSLPLPHALKLAIDDLVAAYERAAMRRGDPGGRRMTEWFWHETAMGAAINRIRDRLMLSEDPTMRAVAYLIFTPFAQAETAADIPGIFEAYMALMPTAG